MCGAWGGQCYLSNDVRNVFACVLQCSISVQNLFEFEVIIIGLCSFMYLLTYPTSDIFYTFLEITSELREIVYYSKRPIGLLFYALSHKTIKIFDADVL